MALLSGPDNSLRSLLAAVGVLHGSTHTPSASCSYIDGIQHGLFGEMWWLEIKVIVSNRDGIHLSGYGNNISGAGLAWEVYDAEGQLVRNIHQNRSKNMFNRLLSRGSYDGDGDEIIGIEKNEYSRKNSTSLQREGNSINPQSAFNNNNININNTSPSFLSKEESTVSFTSQKMRSNSTELNESKSKTSPSSPSSSSSLSKSRANGYFILEDSHGGYRYIFYSYNSCLHSLQIKINNENIIGSPTPYYWGCVGPSVPLFNESRGNILYASSVLTINGWPDANSPEHLRVMNTNSGWLTEGQGLETVVIGFNAIVSIEKIHLLNWAARRYIFIIIIYSFSFFFMIYML